MVVALSRQGPAGILIGCAADAVLADPRRAHPVAGFGLLATALERFMYRDSRVYGALYASVLVTGLAAAGALAQRGARNGLARTAITAAATWVALGGTTLVRTGSSIADLLDAGDIDGARAVLPSLCGRDPAVLDGPGLTRAAVESVAENTSDAQVAPLLWAAIGGAPAVLAYRGINTLDAMVGHRSDRYRRFGWAAARLDDIANFAAARLTAALATLCAPVVGGSASGAIRAWRRDAARHPSPNAGVTEAAFAGALGLQLGDPTQYRHELEIRPTLGDGRRPEVGDLRRAVRLSRAVQISAVAVASAVSAVGRSGRPVSPRR